MKVLQLTKFYPPVFGGIESVVYELAEGLNNRGIDTQVLCANLSREASSELYDGRYQVTRVGSYGKVLSTSVAPAMLGAVKSVGKEVDIIHVHLPDPLTNLALWWSRPKAKIVVHWHSDIVAQKRALKVYAPLQQWLLRRADAIIATSPPYVDSSPWLAPFKSKVFVVPIGMRDPGVQTGQTSFGDGPSKTYVGKTVIFALGRMTYYKGFEVLIRAAQRLPDDCVVLIGGDGDLLETHRNLISELKLESKVILLGRIPSDKLGEYFQRANIFCLPSIARSEAFGVVLLEAMAAGKAIVATDIPGSGVPWVNQHGVNGVNVPPDNANALASAISDLAASPELLKTYGLNARRRFLSEFTADVMVDATAGIYRKIL